MAQIKNGTVLAVNGLTRVWASSSALWPGVPSSALLTIGNSGILYLSGGATLYDLGDGTLWSWGQSYMGSGLGTVSSTDPVSYHGLSQIGTDTNWKDVFGGAFYGFAVKTDGTLWGTGQDSGQGSWGRLYDSGWGPEYNSSTVFTFIQLGSSTDWDTVGCGEYHTIGLKTNGDLYIWGQDVRLMEDTLSGIDTNNSDHRYDRSYSVDVSGRFTPTKCVGNYMGSKIYLSYSSPVPKFILKSDGMLYESGYNGSASTLYRLHPSIPLGLEL